VKIELPKNVLEFYEKYKKHDLRYGDWNIKLSQDLLDLNNTYATVEFISENNCYYHREKNLFLQYDWCNEIMYLNDYNNKIKTTQELIKQLNAIIGRLDKLESNIFQNTCRISELDNKIEAIFRTK
jgi:hypothetical protein